MAYMGIDLGTSSIKIVLIDEKGELLFTSSRAYKNHIFNENWSEQNPDDWYNSSLDIIQELPERVRKKVKSISFSGQMHGLVCLDKDDNILRPAILWNDQRTTEECNYLNNVIGQEEISKYTGNMALTGFTAPKIMWVRNHEPHIFEKISKIMLPKDYLIYKFSGVFATDVSDASGMLLLDVENRSYSKEMLSIVGIQEDQLPSLFESYEVVGKIDSDFSKLTGLNEDVLIVAGGGDQAVGAVGTGTTKDGSCCIALGTSGVLFLSSSIFNYSKNNELHSFCDGTGKYHQMGVMLNAAGAIEWYVKKILGETDFDDVFERLKSVKSSENLFFLPYLIGERTPINDPFAKGTFYGINLNHDKYDLLLSVVEGVCFCLRQMLDIAENMGISVNEIRVTGGGAKSKLWNQLLSNILNKNIYTISIDEGPALGAALLSYAGYSNSKIEDITEELIKVKDKYEPELDKIEFYNTKYEKFNKIYPALKDLGF